MDDRTPIVREPHTLPELLQRGSDRLRMLDEAHKKSPRSNHDLLTVCQSVVENFEPSTLELGNTDPPDHFGHLGSLIKIEQQGNNDTVDNSCQYRIFLTQDEKKMCTTVARRMYKETIHWSDYVASAIAIKLSGSKNPTTNQLQAVGQLETLWSWDMAGSGPDEYKNLMEHFFNVEETTMYNDDKYHQWFYYLPETDEFKLLLGTYYCVGPVHLLCDFHDKFPKGTTITKISIWPGLSGMKIELGQKGDQFKPSEDETPGPVPRRRSQSRDDNSRSGSQRPASRDAPPAGPSSSKVGGRETSPAASGSSGAGGAGKDQKVAAPDNTDSESLKRLKLASYRKREQGK